MTELKKCPHCGGEAEIYIQNKKWTIECKNCFCEISHYTMDSDEMTNAWNKRDGLSMDEIMAVVEYCLNLDCDTLNYLMQEFEKKARG